MVPFEKQDFHNYSAHWEPLQARARAAGVALSIGEAKQLAFLTSTLEIRRRLAAGAGSVYPPMEDLPTSVRAQEVADAMAETERRELPGILDTNPIFRASGIHAFSDSWKVYAYRFSDMKSRMATLDCADRIRDSDAVALQGWVVYYSRGR